MLTYPPFRAIPGLVNAAKGGHALRQGHSGSAVAVMQGSLLDLGMKLPKSTGKFGTPDGHFGDETFKAVKDFQLANKLTPDGVAGKQTINRLDQLMAAKAAKAVPPVPVAPPVRPPPRTSQYQLGTADPSRGADKGAGRWNSKPTEAVYVALKLAIIRILPDATVIIATMP